jgi:hypothetical protein
MVDDRLVNATAAESIWENNEVFEKVDEKVRSTSSLSKTANHYCFDAIATFCLCSIPDASLDSYSEPR